MVLIGWIRGRKSAGMSRSHMADLLESECGPSVGIETIGIT